MDSPQRAPSSSSSSPPKALESSASSTSIKETHGATRDDTAEQKEEEGQLEGEKLLAPAAFADTDAAIKNAVMNDFLNGKPVRSLRTQGKPSGAVVEAETANPNLNPKEQQQQQQQQHQERRRRRQWVKLEEENGEEDEQAAAPTSTTTPPRAERDAPARDVSPPQSVTHVSETTSDELVQSQHQLPEPPEGLSLLSAEQWTAIISCVPIRFRLLSKKSQWRTLYSSDKNGTSLSLLLRSCGGVSPTILIIEDSDGVVFGSYCSDRWNLNNDARRFFGTGECFVFTTKQQHSSERDDEQKANARKVRRARGSGHRRRASLASSVNIFRWGGGTVDERLADADSASTNENLPSNSNFQHLVAGAIVIGMAPQPAIRLTDGLPMTGTSGTCDTFNSRSLSGREDFECHTVQVLGLASD